MKNNNTIVMIAAAAAAYWFWKNHAQPATGGPLIRQLPASSSYVPAANDSFVTLADGTKVPLDEWNAYAARISGGG